MWLPAFISTPKKFVTFSDRALPVLWKIFLISIVIGTVWGIAFTPADYLQGHLAKIMYVHVPAAWFSLFCYTLLASFSAAYIIWRHPLSAILAESIAPVGLLLGCMCLITGSIWGHPTWGTWWVWDARLTSMLVLVLLFAGYLLLLKSSDNPAQGNISAAWLAVIGFINVPIVKFSVNWWNSLHQDSSISSLKKLANPAIDSSMLWPLYIMAVTFFCFISIALLKNTKNLIAERRYARS